MLLPPGIGAFTSPDRGWYMYALIDYTLKLFSVSQGRSKKGHSASVSCAFSLLLCALHIQHWIPDFQSAVRDFFKILIMHQNNLQETLQCQNYCIVITVLWHWQRFLAKLRSWEHFLLFLNSNKLSLNKKNTLLWNDRVVFDLIHRFLQGANFFNYSSLGDLEILSAINVSLFLHNLQSLHFNIQYFLILASNEGCNNFLNCC